MVYTHPAARAVQAGIGALIRERRTELGWSQETLAGELGLPDNTVVSRYERGGGMRLTTLGRLAAALSVDPIRLLPDDPFGLAHLRLGPPSRLGRVGRVTPWTRGRRGAPRRLPWPGEGREMLVLLAVRVRERRAELQWTQRRLAEWTGLDQSYVGRVENGRLDVRISMLLRLAEALDLKPSDLLTKYPAPHGTPARKRLLVVGRTPTGGTPPPRLESIGIYAYR